MPWVYDPHSGGVKIPSAVQRRTEQRVRAYADNHYAGRFTRLNIRFRGALCYIDAYTEAGDPPESLLKMLGETLEEHRVRLENSPLHLCRLRYFGNEERWSMAIYLYSSEKYEPCVFDSGNDHGTPEEAFETASVYLQNT